jgi:hypothetical protein
MQSDLFEGVALGTACFTVCIIMWIVFAYHMRYDNERLVDMITTRQNDLYFDESKTTYYETVDMHRAGNVLTANVLKKKKDGDQIVETSPVMYLLSSVCKDIHCLTI